MTFAAKYIHDVFFVKKICHRCYFFQYAMQREEPLTKSANQEMPLCCLMIGSNDFPLPTFNSYKFYCNGFVKDKED